jgi:hypothetical protein
LNILDVRLDHATFQWPPLEFYSLFADYQPVWLSHSVAPHLVCVSINLVLFVGYPGIPRFMLPIVFKFHLEVPNGQPSRED